MTLPEIAQQMCRMKECEEFPLKWKTEVEGWIFDLNQWAEVAEVIPDAEWNRELIENGVSYKYKCKNCKNMSIKKSKFCPNCGARMKVEPKRVANYDRCMDCAYAAEDSRASCRNSVVCENPDKVKRWENIVATIYLRRPDLLRRDKEGNWDRLFWKKVKTKTSKACSKFKKKESVDEEER